MESYTSFAPAMWEFGREFGLKIIIIIMIVVFVTQIARLIGMFFRSRAWRTIVTLVTIGTNRFARVCGPCATLVHFVQEIARWIGIAFTGFHAIDAEDNVEQAALKVRANFLRGFAYDVWDYWAAIICALMVTYMVDHDWSLVEQSVIVWLFNIVIVYVSLKGCTITGQDLTLGEAHRRAFESLYARKKFAGWLYKLIQHPIAVIWDGPEQLVVFYQQELKSRSQVVVAAVGLTAVQSIFWAAVYGFGYESVSEIIKVL